MARQTIKMTFRGPRSPKVIRIAQTQKRASNGKRKA
jgi:hypothetical protein